MKYFSETLNKVFDTEQECTEAENLYNQAQQEAEARQQALTEQRATRAKEVEDAYKAVIEAKKVYSDLLHDFVADYGSYHMTYKSNNEPFFSFFDWF